MMTIILLKTLFYKKKKKKMINNNGIDIWEFLKGLTARVVCLEDALLMKNK